MPNEKPVLKGFTEENWTKRWEIIEKIVDLARKDRAPHQMAEEFKIDRKEVNKYLQILASIENNDSYIGAINNSLVVLSDKIIAMDHNPGPDDYNHRYIGMGKFGKVKLGMDKEGNPYALKVERQKSDVKSLREKNIMKKIGVLVGAVSYQTSTQKPWIDEKPISEKLQTVMTLISGEQLSKYFDYNSSRYRFFDSTEKLLIGLGIIRAIDALNDKGIAHRDSTLANFMLDITQLPPDLTIHNIDDYLAGKLPGYDFAKLIREIDWGLACEIPIDGSEIHIPGLTYVLEYTAPEYYFNGACSRLSESYTVAKLLGKDIGITDAVLSSITPRELTVSVRQYETDNDKLNSFVRKYAGSSETDRQELQTELQKLIFVRDESMKNLAQKLTQYPPSERPSLSELYSHLQQSLKTNLESIHKASAFRVPLITPAMSSSSMPLSSASYAEHSSSAAASSALGLSSGPSQGSSSLPKPESSVPLFSSKITAAERNKFIATFCMSNNADLTENMINAQSLNDLHEISRFLDSPELSPMISMLAGDFPEKIKAAISTLESSSSFSAIKTVGGRNDFLSSVCLSSDPDIIEKTIQTQSLDDLREMVRFLDGKDLNPLVSALMGDLKEKVEVEISKRKISPST